MQSEACDKFVDRPKLPNDGHLPSVEPVFIQTVNDNANDLFFEDDDNQSFPEIEWTDAQMAQFENEVEWFSLTALEQDLYNLEQTIMFNVAIPGMSFLPQGYTMDFQRFMRALCYKILLRWISTQQHVVDLHDLPLTHYVPSYVSPETIAAGIAAYEYVVEHAVIDVAHMAQGIINHLNGVHDADYWGNPNNVVMTPNQFLAEPATTFEQLLPHPVPSVGFSVMQAEAPPTLGVDGYPLGTVWRLVDDFFDYQPRSLGTTPAGNTVERPMNDTNYITHYGEHDHDTRHGVVCKYCVRMNRIYKRMSEMYAPVVHNVLEGIDWFEEPEGWMGPRVVSSCQTYLEYFLENAHSRPLVFAPEVLAENLNRIRPLREPPREKTKYCKPRLDRQARRDIKEGRDAHPVEPARLSPNELRRLRKVKKRILQAEGPSPTWFVHIFDTMVNLVSTVQEHWTDMLVGPAVDKMRSLMDKLCDSKMWIHFLTLVRQFASKFGDIYGFFTDTENFMRNNITLSKEVLAMILGLLMKIVFGKMISMSGFSALSRYIITRALPGDLWVVVSKMFLDSANWFTEHFGEAMGANASTVDSLEGRVHRFLRYNGGQGGCPPPPNSPFKVADPCPVTTQSTFSSLAAELDRALITTHDAPTAKRLGILKADMDQFYSNNERTLNAVASSRAFGIGLVGPSGVGKTFLVNDLIDACARSIHIDPADASRNWITGCQDPKFFPHTRRHDFALVGDDLNSVRFDPNTPPLNGINVGFALMSGVDNFIPPTADVEGKKTPYSANLYIQTSNDEALSIPQIFTPASQAAAARRFALIIKCQTPEKYKTNGYIDKEKIKGVDSFNVYQVGRYVVHPDGGWSWECIKANCNYAEMAHIVVVMFRRHTIAEAESAMERILRMAPNKESCAYCRMAHPTDLCPAKSLHTPDNLLPMSQPVDDLGPMHKMIKLGLLISRDNEGREARREERERNSEHPLEFVHPPPLPNENHLSTFRATSAMQAEGPSVSKPKYRYVCATCSKVLGETDVHLGDWAYSCPVCDELEVEEFIQSNEPQPTACVPVEFPRARGLLTGMKRFAVASFEDPLHPKDNFEAAFGAGILEYAKCKMPGIVATGGREFERWKSRQWHTARRFARKAWPGVKLMMILGMCYKLGIYIYKKAKPREVQPLPTQPALQAEGANVSMMDEFPSKSVNAVYGEKAVNGFEAVSDILMSAAIRGATLEHFEQVLTTHQLRMATPERVLNVFALGGEFVILPGHGLPTIFPFSVSLVHPNPHVARVKYVVHEAKKVNETDMVIIKLPGLVGFRDVHHYFPIDINAFTGVAVFKGEKGIVTYQATEVFGPPDALIKGGFAMAGGFKSEKGDCGYPVVQKKGTPAILGFHVAGSHDDDKAKGVYLTQAAVVLKGDIENCIKTFPFSYKGYGEIRDTLVGKGEHIDPKPYNAKHPNFQAEFSDAGFPGYPLGRVEGSVNNSSRLEPTLPLMHAFCLNHLKRLGKDLRPAIMTIFVDKDGKTSDTFHASFGDKSVKPVLWDKDLGYAAINQIVQEIGESFANVTFPEFNTTINPPGDPRRFPDCEATWHTAAINLSTASGYGGGPKSNYMEKIAQEDGSVWVYSRDDELPAKCARCIDTLRERKLLSTVVCLNSKDNEVREHGKAARGIYSFGLPVLLVARTVLAPLRFLFASKPHGMECMVGINPHSKDWEQMVREFDGKFMLGGDFKKFDCCIAKPNWILLAILVRMLYFLFDFPFKEIVDLLILSLIFAPILWKNAIYYMVFGHPSGFPFTAELNSLMGRLIKTMVGIVLAIRLWARFYGDDNLIAMLTKIDLVCWVETWKMFGMTMTSAHKDKDLEYENWDTLTFLKRGFLPTTHGDFHFLAAPLELASIYKSGLYYVRPTVQKTETPDGIRLVSMKHEYIVMGQIIDSMLREAGAHGPFFYDELRVSLEPIATKYGLISPYLSKSYDDWVADYRKGALTEHWDW